MKRASGVLMHITSLPSPYGIGTMGRAAYEFVDFLHRARQRYWQVLPLTPTGFGDSPYQSASTFAGNPYLIDLDMLLEQGLLTREEIGQDWGEDPRHVDFGLMYARKYAVLEKAFARFDRAEMADFCRSTPWLAGWTLFAALKDHFTGRPGPSGPRIFGTEIRRLCFAMGSCWRSGWPFTASFSMCLTGNGTPCGIMRKNRG